ncbi:hypothetical protein [Pseudomonas putida]
MIHDEDLPTSVLLGVDELRRHRVSLSSPSQIIVDLGASMRSHQGVMILPATQINGARSYEVIQAVGKPVNVPATTMDHLWSCTKQHYGLTAATAITGAAGIPIPKVMVGAWVHKGSSATTNFSSIVGWEFFPRTLIRQPMLAKAAKATFGTVRVFGIIGRGVPFVDAGLAVFDLVSIGACVYEAQHAK